MQATQERAKQIVVRLELYIRSEGYQGWDPYDALNSKVLGSVTAFHPFAQRVAIHVIKLLPWNLRRFLGIAKEYNPTALSLCIDSYVNLYLLDAERAHIEAAIQLLDIVLGMACINTDEELGWGRNFTFVTETERHETSKPLTFLNAKIGRSILNLYTVTGDPALLLLVRKLITTIIRQGKIFRVNGQTFVGYSAASQPRLILNASILSAALFLNYVRLYGQEDCIIEGESLKGLVHEISDTVLTLQNNNGSWPYGLTFAGKRLENVDFHQGFVLDALLELLPGLEEDSRTQAQAAYERGLLFMAQQQIDAKGFFKWRYPRKFPADIHNQAQGIISLSKARHEFCENRLKAVVNFTLDNFWDGKRNFFYYQKYPFFTNRISYLRWSQGWMFFALSEFLKNKAGSK